MGTAWPLSLLVLLVHKVTHKAGLQRPAMQVPNGIRGCCYPYSYPGPASYLYQCQSLALFSFHSAE